MPSSNLTNLTFGIVGKTISDEVRAELRLDVDEHNLLEEWQGQAAMMLEYSIRLADARLEEDECRNQLAVVVAELDAAIRDDPEDYGLQKATETSVNNAIPGCDEHIAASKAYREARHAVRINQAAVEALEHRKSTLKGMTDLWMRQYYADPKSPEQPAPLKEAAGSGKGKKSIEWRRKKRRRD